VSRPTIQNYLSILEATFVAHPVRPFSSQASREITSAPKVYFFDTGFFCYFKGWDSLRAEDYGILWEHFVLNELHAHLQTREIYYWRDKRQHEIDFVLKGSRRNEITTIECKWKAKDFDIRNLGSFRGLYPTGQNYVVSSDIPRSYKKSLETSNFILSD
jgi:predicted AAA+ superfamily ATPase